MPRIHAFLFVLLACVLTTIHAERLDASELCIILNSENVETYVHPDTTLGKYYTITFAVPEEVRAKELHRAYLELYVDVSAIERDGFLDKTPVIEIYALRGMYAGEIDTILFDTSSRMVRNLVLGENQRLIIDISEAIKKCLAAPPENVGFIIGALTGQSGGIFSLREDGIFEGGFAKVVYQYEAK